MRQLLHFAVNKTHFGVDINRYGARIENDEKRLKKIEEIGTKMVTLEKETHRMQNIWGLEHENKSLL